METKIFPGKYDSLVDISKFIKNIAKTKGYEGLTLYTIETAVDEACSNIIEHAYRDNHHGDIEISIGFEKDNLVIILKDHGVPFDPHLIAPPNLSENLDEREPHGLGLYMIKQWMDEVYFETSENTNTLKMIKYKVD